MVLGLIIKFASIKWLINGSQLHHYILMLLAQMLVIQRKKL